VRPCSRLYTMDGMSPPGARDEIRAAFNSKKQDSGGGLKPLLWYERAGKFNAAIFRCCRRRPAL
jgi:hypothetical protein